jgi:hypothetical protein
MTAWLRTIILSLFITAERDGAGKIARLRFNLLGPATFERGK